jgi:hypothetical protein
MAFPMSSISLSLATNKAFRETSCPLVASRTLEQYRFHQKTAQSVKKFQPTAPFQ